MKKKDAVEYVPTLDEYKKRGLFAEYSNDHFLMKILDGNAFLPDNFQHELFQSIGREKEGVSFDNLAFGLSFSARLCNMFALFEDKDITDFLSKQFSAGKEKFNKATFFQALSEIECINYVANMVPNSGEIECQYEPKNNGKKNPEARIQYCESADYKFYYDIEVKTANFDKKPVNIIPGNRYIKINIPLVNDGYENLKGMAEVCNYEVISPNYLKIKDFIHSAQEKFIEPKDEDHINILFINWSFIAPTESQLMEPCALLYDEKFGLLKSTLLHKQCKIETKWLEKISAIVVYCDNYDSIISCNLLTAVQMGLCKIMFNDKFCKYVNKEKILGELRIPEATDEDGCSFEIWGNLDSGDEEDIKDAYVMNKAASVISKYMFKDGYCSEE